MAIPVVGKFLLQRVAKIPGVFFLRYIVSCACLTNANSLLQIPQLIIRACARRAAKTARESIEAEVPIVFAWGYWYAWTISVFALSICMSSTVPSSLPCATFFFTVQHWVDKYNLTRGVYGHGPDIEHQNMLATRVLHYLRAVISVWWGVVGAMFLLRTYDLQKDWDSPVRFQIVQFICFGLIFSSGVLVLFSWWTQQTILHDSHFEDVHLEKTGFERFADVGISFHGLIHRIECCLNCFKGRGNYPTIDSDDSSPHLRRLSDDSTPEGIKTGTNTLDGESPEYKVLPREEKEESGDEESVCTLSYDVNKVLLDPLTTGAFPL